MAFILQWNIRGFYSNYGDLLHIFEDREPVCMCIEESMLRDRVPCSPPGYSLERFSTTQQQTPGNLSGDHYQANCSILPSEPRHTPTSFSNKNATS